jgi:hypothetical protein
VIEPQRKKQNWFCSTNLINLHSQMAIKRPSVIHPTSAGDVG